MLCTPHITTQPIPLCVSMITVGTIANLSASLKAQLKNTSTGYTSILDASSNGAGLVTIDTEGNNFSPNTTYILSLSITTGGDKIDVTISGQTENEIYLRFEDYRDGDGGTVTEVNHTLVGI